MKDTKLKQNWVLMVLLIIIIIIIVVIIMAYSSRQQENITTQEIYNVESYNEHNIKEADAYRSTLSNDSYTWTIEENREYNIILLRLANSQLLLKNLKDTSDRKQ